MWYVALGFAALSFGITFASGFAAGRIARTGRRWLTIALGFGGGFMMAVALADIIPEAAEQAKSAYHAVAVGFAAFFMIEQLLDAHFCPPGEERCERDHASTGPLAVVGLGLHGLIDGVAFASALAADVRLAVMVALAILVHKVPDGFCFGTLLVSKRYSPESARRQLAAFSLTTPLGVIAAKTAFSGAVNPGLALGLSAGSFIYIATSHLLPEAKLEVENAGPLVLSVIIGIGVAIFLPSI